MLERVAKGESKRATARFAGVSRSTVGRITDRVELYREFDADWKAAADGGLDIAAVLDHFDERLESGEAEMETGD